MSVTEIERDDDGTWEVRISNETGTCAVGFDLRVMGKCEDTSISAASYVTRSDICTCPSELTQVIE